MCTVLHRTSSGALWSLGGSSWVLWSEHVQLSLESPVGDVGNFKLVFLHPKFARHLLRKEYGLYFAKGCLKVRCLVEKVAKNRSATLHSHLREAKGGVERLHLPSLLAMLKALDPQPGGLEVSIFALS